MSVGFVCFFSCQFLDDWTRNGYIFTAIEDSAELNFVDMAGQQRLYLFKKGSKITIKDNVMELDVKGVEEITKLEG